MLLVAALLIVPMQALPALSAANRAAGVSAEVSAAAATAPPSLEEPPAVNPPSFPEPIALASLIGNGEQRLAPPAVHQPGRLPTDAMNFSGSSEPMSLAFTPARAAAPFDVPSERKLNKRLWLGLAIAQHGAATFDAWSTRKVITGGQGRELNPLLRPFAGSGVLYAAMQVGPGVLDMVGLRLMTSRRPWMRRLWWLPQVAGTAVSLASGIHNLGVPH